MRRFSRALTTELTTLLGYVALILILAEGGLTTRWSDMRRGLGPAVVLATVGVGVSVVVTAAFAVWLSAFLIACASSRIT